MSALAPAVAAPAPQGLHRPPSVGALCSWHPAPPTPWSAGGGGEGGAEPGLSGITAQTYAKGQLPLNRVGIRSLCDQPWPCAAPSPPRLPSFCSSSVSSARSRDTPDSRSAEPANLFGHSRSALPPKAQQTLTTCSGGGPGTARDDAIHQIQPDEQHLPAHATVSLLHRGYRPQCGILVHDALPCPTHAALPSDATGAVIQITSSGPNRRLGASLYVLKVVRAARSAKTPAVEEVTSRRMGQGWGVATLLMPWLFNM